MTSTAVRIPGYVAGTWQIDPAHSDVGFVVRHMMVAKVRGHFTSFSGQIVTAPDPLESSVTATIDVGSIDTRNDSRDDHVRSADFFAADVHPTMSFTSTGVRCEDEEFFVDGTLTIRGVTRPVTLAVEMPHFLRVSEGGAKAGFSATAEINRTDYGVNYNGPVPGGGMSLGEKVQILLEIEADLVPAVPAGEPVPGEAATQR